MALYYTVSYLIIGVILQYNIRKSIEATVVPIPSNPILEISDDVCTTLACNESATRLLSNMDGSVDPCDDFYKFSCGGFIETTEIPDDYEVSAFRMLRDEVRERLRGIIEEPSPPNEPRHIKITRNYYKSCMNEDIIEKRGLEPFKKKLKELGGWPVLEGQQWNETGFHWVDVVHKFHKAGYAKDYFIDSDIVPDFKNNTKKVLHLTVSPTGLASYTLADGMENADVKMYFELMVDIAVMLGAPREYAIAELRESLMFEILLARLHSRIPFSHNRTLFYNPLTVNQLSEKYPSIPWRKYINNIFSPYDTVHDDEIIILCVPELMSEFMELMRIVRKRAQANYAMWRVVKDTASYLNQEVARKSSEYSMKLYSKVKPEPRWEKCIKEIVKLIPVHAMYVRKYFKESAKNKTIEMVYDILSQLRTTLHTLDWMDDETRQNALKKASAISPMVGYPNEILNDTILEEYYKNLDFTDDNYLENKLTFVRFMLNDTYKKYRQLYEKNSWEHDTLPATVAAFFNVINLKIEFSAGILQGAFFNEHLPGYMNYGAIGSVIGHEITHAFGVSGRQVDNEGNHKDWWSKFSDEKYRKKTECIINQYSNYTVKEIGKKLHGFYSQGEDIADNGGFKIAYHAYKDWSIRREKEQSLPGLKYNPQQMFWISAASVFCAKYRAETFEKYVMNDVHSPDEFRVLGPLRNLPEFATDFNCPVGSKMNPIDKCTFW